MRILAFSDLHDEEAALEKLRSVYVKTAFDAVFITGDTTNVSYSFLEETIGSFNKSPVFWIPGNNEPPNVLERAGKLKNYLHGKQTKLGTFAVVGFGMSPPTPFMTPNELSEDEIYSSLAKLKIDSNTILLTHAPPLGCFDMTKKGNAGSSAIRRIVEEKQPFALFCGHIHEHQGVEKIGKTTVVKLPCARDGRCCVAELDDKISHITVKFLKL